MNIAFQKENVTIFQFLTGLRPTPWMERDAYNSQSHPVMARLVPRGAKYA